MAKIGSGTSEIADLRSKEIRKYVLAIILALPVAALAIGDFIVAVNVQWGWKSEADAAPVAVPLFLLLWTGMSYYALAAGSVNRGTLRLTNLFIVFSLCLPLAIMFQDAANDFKDPIFPPVLILIATTIFVTAPMVVVAMLIRRATLKNIESEERGSSRS